MNLLKLNHEELKQVIKTYYYKKIPLMAYGGFGIGKSQNIKEVALEIAKEKNKEFVDWNRINSKEKRTLINNTKGKFIYCDIRTTQIEPTDLRGLPLFNGDKDFVDWKPNLIFSLLSEKEADGLIFFDEMNNACFPKGTMISGEEIKPIEEFKVGDKVIDYLGNFKKVKGIMKREYKDKTYTIKAFNKLPFKATAEHPILAIENYRKANKKWNVKENISYPKWIKAKNIKKGMYVGIPIIKDLIDVDKIDIYKYLTTKKSVNIPNIVETKIKLNNDLAELIGLYVSDGAYSMSRINLYFNKIEKDIIERATGILKGFGLDVRYKNKGNCVVVTASSSILGEWIKDICGKNAFEKRIPNFILYNKDKEILHYFLKGFWKGDGSVINYKKQKSSYVVMNTISPILARQLQLAFARFNISIGLNKNNIEGKKSFIKKEGRTIIAKHNSYAIKSNINEMFRLFDLEIPNKKRETKFFFEHKGILWTKVYDIIEEDFSDYVYNLDVEDTETYLVENTIVHNSPMVMASLYQIFLDRAIGEISINQDVGIISAGNRIGVDKANVFEVPSPLKDRMGEVELLIPDKEDWVNWALKEGNKIDSRVISFIHFKPSYLYSVDDKNKDKSATPRGWERVSNLIYEVPSDNLDLLKNLVSSAIGEGIGLEFTAFVKLQEKIDIEEYLKNPKKVKDITREDLKYPLLGVASEYFKKHKKKEILEKMLDICENLDIEYSILLARFLKVIDEKFFREELGKMKKFNNFLNEYSKYLL